MAPAHAYLGRFTNDGGEVRSLELRQALYSGDVASGTAALPGDGAAPVEPELIRDAGGTTLRFARRLRPAAELPRGAQPVALGGASPDARNYLNWAYGADDELGYHGASHRGSFVQTFERAAAQNATQAAALPATTAPAAPSARPPRNPLPPPARLRTHGRLMLIAWAGLLPFGATLGRLVQNARLAPHSLRVHVAVQVAGVAVATTSFALIVAGACCLLHDVHAHTCFNGKPNCLQRCATAWRSTTRSASRTRTARLAWPR